MKRYGFLFVNILLILFTASFFAFSKGKSKQKSLNSSSFKGVIIFVNNEYLELKLGKREMVMYFSENTKTLSRKWTPLDKSAIQICQYARAYYGIKDKKKILNKIVILREGYCGK